jgi:hypothetical protein
MSSTASCARSIAWATTPNPRGLANSYRKVEVKVLNGDYHVRHRKTYLTGPQ